MISKEKAELIGAIIGDGFLYKKKNTIGIVGSPQTDREYFEIIKKLILNVWNKDIRIVTRARGLRITFGSKQVFSELVDEFNLPSGESKCYTVTIPEKIYSNWELAKHTIRGIVDTDGSVFVADKPGCPKYPSIEITTVSEKLALQIREILIERGFRVARIWSYKSKLATVKCYKVPLNGRKNLAKWIKEIGFSNPHKQKKAEKALNESGASGNAHDQVLA